MLTRVQIRNTAEIVRRIELTVVLQRVGANVDKSDPAKWHTSQGVLSVTGQQFFNWTQGAGGGGAIDLIMHLEQIGFIKAVCWLADHYSYAGDQASTPAKSPDRISLVLPRRNPTYLPQISRYLTLQRYLPPALIQSHINAGKLYADDRANAVFLLLGKGRTIVGAEIRGTSKRPWYALASGSRKDLGCFSVKYGASTKIVLCESAIDALSYYTLDANCVALSTAGARSNPPWLGNLIKKGFQVYCGFDADTTGDTLARDMIAVHPTIKRLRPTRHDWNDVLKCSHTKSPTETLW